MLILWTLSLWFLFLVYFCFVLFFFFELGCSSKMQLFQWVESDDVSTEQEMVLNILASALD